MSPQQPPHPVPATGLLEAPARRAIVAALERYRHEDDPVRAGGMTSAQLGDVVGLHPTTVRFHTDRLEAAGLIRSHVTTAFGVGRPRKVFVAARTVSGSDRSAHLLRLLQLMTESFNSGASPEEAGERWARQHLHFESAAPATSPGAWLGKLGPLVDALRDWGYAPEVATTDGGRTCRITLTDCPFVELARDNVDIVCGIHEGLLRGAMGQLGEDDVEVSVDPFDGPDLCHARITTRRTFDQHDQHDHHDHHDHHDQHDEGATR